MTGALRSRGSLLAPRPIGANSCRNEREVHRLARRTAILEGRPIVCRANVLILHAMQIAGWIRDERPRLGAWGEVDRGIVTRRPALSEKRIVDPRGGSSTRERRIDMARRNGRRFGIRPFEEHRELELIGTACGERLLLLLLATKTVERHIGNPEHEGGMEGHGKEHRPAAKRERAGRWTWRGPFAQHATRGETDAHSFRLSRREANAKAALRILRGLTRNFLERRTAELRHTSCSVRYVCGLAGLPAHRNGRKIRTIGLDQNPVRRRKNGSLLDSARTLEGDDARERNVEVEVERSFGEGHILTKTVYNTTNILRIFGAEDLECIRRRVARVNDERLSERTRKGDLRREGVALQRPRRRVVVIVEARLPNRNDFGSGGELFQSVLLDRIGFCIVGVHADARVDHPRIGLRQRDGPFGRFRIASDADHHEAYDSDGVGALHHRARSFRKVLGIEMAMRIDEVGHACKDGAKVDEEQARAFLDDDGYLRSAAEAPLALSRSYLVFSQHEGVRLDMFAWQKQATRFFQTRVGLALPKASGRSVAFSDAFLFLVEPPNTPLAKRLVWLRPRTNDDLDLAQRIEAVEGARGMSDLAGRCKGVCLIESEGATDRAALVLAALAASILLGPIVPPDQQEIFGVRTAREKLEALSSGAAYRS